MDHKLSSTCSIAADSPDHCSRKVPDEELLTTQFRRSLTELDKVFNRYLQGKPAPRDAPIIDPFIFGSGVFVQRCQHREVLLAEPSKRETDHEAHLLHPFYC
ncbi:hypothetical protein Ciccas_004550 [Cichlidogyrus casuarinus]|uniref:Uncharacterized protein n=1 Tax=Cichlidogyrus casuarinus TaxID=1844966 RepID=A0ABD2QDH9_9PLAT